MKGTTARFAEMRCLFVPVRVVAAENMESGSC